MCNPASRLGLRVPFFVLKMAEGFRVKEVLPGPDYENHAGHLAVDNEKVFFWFCRNARLPPNRLIVWLNGGKSMVPAINSS